MIKSREIAPVRETAFPSPIGSASKAATITNNI